MKTIKHFIEAESKMLTILITLSTFSIFLLMFRMKLTQSYYFLFLVWNLFLAGIPYVISSYTSTLKNLNTYMLLAISCIWLLFLPNAPYIVTDLFHLQYSNTHVIWLDTLVIVVFAITGLLLFFKSVLTMEAIFINKFGKRLTSLTSPLFFMLVGFGIYLGRFLRFNSWEIISKPLSIIKTIFEIITQPILYQKAWMFAIIFGLFLWIGYYVFKSFTKIKA